MSNTSQSPEMVSLLEWYDEGKISSLFSHLTWTLKALVIVDSDVHFPSFVNTKQTNAKNHFFQRYRCCRSFLMCEYWTNNIWYVYILKLIAGQAITTSAEFIVDGHGNPPNITLFHLGGSLQFTHAFVSTHVNSQLTPKMLPQQIKNADRQVQTDGYPFLSVMISTFFLSLDFSKQNYRLIWLMTEASCTQEALKPCFHDFRGSTRIVDPLINCRLPDCTDRLRPFVCLHLMVLGRREMIKSVSLFIFFSIIFVSIIFKF